MGARPQSGELWQGIFLMYASPSEWGKPPGGKEFLLSRSADALMQPFEFVTRACGMHLKCFGFALGPYQ